MSLTENLTEMNKLIGEQRELQERRALLDKALIGVGSMIELADRLKPNSIASHDPEAAAAEALDLIKIAEGAATAERQRIVAAIRHLSGEWNDLVEHSGKLASAWLADEIEAGRL
jgi:hypothetical protein